MSVDGAGRHHPLAGLPGDFGDEVEVCVLTEHRDGRFFGSRGHQKVWYLAAPLAALGQEALDLEGPWPRGPNGSHMWLHIYML